jgi:hypothetical protein
MDMFFFVLLISDNCQISEIFLTFFLLKTKTTSLHRLYQAERATLFELKLI